MLIQETLCLLLAYCCKTHLKKQLKNWRLVTCLCMIWCSDRLASVTTMSANTCMTWALTHKHWGFHSFPASGLPFFHDDVNSFLAHDRHYFSCFAWAISLVCNDPSVLHPSPPTMRHKLLRTPRHPDQMPSSSESLPWFSHITSLDLNIYLFPMILQKDMTPNIVNSKLST